MKFYVEAYYEDGNPILGNCDGQTVLRCRNPRRTKHYRHIKDVIANGKYPRVSYYKIVDEYGRLFETLS